MSNRKTPRTLIGGYLDAAKTQQTVYPARTRRAVTRSPEIGRSPHQTRSLKHDRVASLQKRVPSQLVSTSISEEETPRHLIEGFIDGNDSTVPLARLKRRTSQTGVSASQPARSATRRASSVPSHTRRSSLSLDLETPRTLLQRFLQNVTAVDDTPLAARPTQTSVQRTPIDAPASQGSDSYSTPSPFKASSHESVVSVQSANRRQTPRTRTPGKFHVMVRDTQEARNEGDDGDLSSSLTEDIVPASQMYDEPSMFGSSSSDTDISPRQTQSQRPTHQGRFSAMAPQHLVDEYTRRRTLTDVRRGEGLTDDQEDEELIDDQRAEELSDDQEELPDNYGQGDPDSGDGVAGRDTVQEPYHMYELPLKASDGVTGEPMDSDEPPAVNEVAESLVDERSYSRSGVGESFDDVPSYSRTSEDDYDPGVSSIQKYNVSETIRSSQDVHEQISEIDTESSHRNQETRHSDGERRGRWSEGHQSRYNSPRSQVDRRLSEGHRYTSSPGRASSMPLEGPFPSPRSARSNISYRESPQDISRSLKSPLQSPRSVRSNTSYRGSPRQTSLPLESHDSPRSNRSSHISEGHSRSSVSNQPLPGDGLRLVLDHPSPAGSDSESGTGDEEPQTAGSETAASDSYMAYDLGRLATTHTDHIHTMPNTTSNFSPRITSTQNRETFARPSPLDPSITPRCPASPVSSPSSHLGHVSPSPRLSTSSQRMSTSSQRLSTSNQRPSTSQRLSNQRLSTSSQNLSGQRLSTSSQRLSSSNQKLSSSQRISSSSQRMSTSSQRMSSYSQRLSGNQRLSLSGEVLYTVEGVGDGSPLEAVNPSPAVSPLDAPTPGMGSIDRVSPRSGSLGRVSTRSSTGSSRLMSTRSSRGSVGDMSIRSSTWSVGQMSAESIRHSSKRPSTGSEKQMAKRRRSSGLDTLPDSTLRFSPEAASTQRPQTGAVDSRDQSPLDTVSPSPRVSPSGVPSQHSVHTDIDDASRSEWDNDVVDVDPREDRNVLAPALATANVPPKRAVRKPRKKPVYSMPVSLVKKQFTHFAALRVSREAIDEVMKVSELYWDHLASDLEAYTRHAGRKTITMNDLVLLFKRQGLVDEKQSLNSLIEKYLPMEERAKLIHVARSGNRIEPKL